MTTSTLTLTDFLLARIAEDEAVARSAVVEGPESAHWWAVVDRHDDAPDAPLTLIKGENPLDPEPGEDPTYALGAVHVCHGDEPSTLPHIARHDPARVLAECEAKRRIVDLHDRKHHQCVSDDPEDGPATLWRTFANSCDTLRLLALPYGDHPDYREEWRV